MRAKWHGQPYHDYKENKWLLTFETEASPVIYDDTKDKEIVLDISAYSEKRGLTANSYFWVLVNKIAKKTGQTDTDVHDELLKDNISFIMKDGVIDYFITDEEPGKYGMIKKQGKTGYEYYITRGDKVLLSKPDGSYYIAPDGKPKTTNIYWHIKGTHQMNKEEMSMIIDDTVNEAKELGIETMTPKEIERLKSLWNPS